MFKQRCPRCIRGTLIPEKGGGVCINCGWRPVEILGPPLRVVHNEQLPGGRKRAIRRGSKRG